MTTPKDRVAMLSMLLATAVMYSVHAQTTNESADTTADDEKVTTIEKYEITGSRIPQMAGEATVTPVISVLSEDFQRYGISDIADLGRVIPQLGPSTGGNTWTDLIGTGPSEGLSNRSSFSIGGMNLANSSLGGITLVLVDGRRLAKSGQAFSGQGNLEDYDLNGIPIDAIDRIEILTGGASAIYGSDAMAGVVNIILKKNHGYNSSTVTVRYDNAFDTDASVLSTSFSTTMRKGKFSLFAAGSYRTANALASSDRWYTATTDLTTFGGAYDNRMSYLGAVWTSDGTTYAIPSGSDGTSTIADFETAGDAEMYDSAVDTLLINPSTERSLVIRGGYDFKSWLNLYTEFRWNEKTSTSILVPSIGYYYPAYDWGSGLSIPAGAAGNPFDETVTLNKIYTDLVQTGRSTSSNPSAMIGIDGDFGAAANWHYDTYFSWARSEQKYDGPGNFDTTALAEAIAAGNAPILIYDSAAGNPNDAGVLEAFLTDDWNTELTDTFVYNATVRGLIYTLPAGDVQMVVGGEWMEDRSNFDANPDSSYADYLLDGTISRSDTAGFAEIQVPLISSAQAIPLVNNLSVNASVRHDEYSDVGGATTNNIGALLKPASWMSIRASRSEGFKPASLWDLYGPYYDFGGYTFSGTRYGLYDPVLEEDVGTIGYYQVGHTDLKPMTSVSQSVGIVLDVPYVKGLSFAVDFVKTEIENATGSVDYQVLIDEYPDRVVRDPDTNRITMLDTSSVNTAHYESQSISYSLSYNRSTSWGDWSFRASYADTMMARSQSTETSTPFEAWMPKRFAASLGWQRGALGASLSTVYQGSFNMYPSYLVYGYDYTYASYVEWNPGITYDFGRGLGGGNSLLKDLHASVTVVNVFDSQPSLATAGSGYLVQDTRGRRFVLELTKKF